MRRRRLRRKKGRKPVKGRERERNEHRGVKRSKEGGVRSLLRQVDNRGPAGRKSKQNGNKTSENIEGISVADEKDVIISQKNLPRRNQQGKRGSQRRSQRRRKGKKARGKKKGGREMRVVLRSQLKSLKSVEDLDENKDEEDKLTEEEKEEERKRKMRKRMKRLRKSRQLYLEQEQYRLI